MRTTWQLARDAGVLWLGYLLWLVMWACAWCTPSEGDCRAFAAPGIPT